MGGLAKICKIYGGMEFIKDGRSTTWRYDYKNDRPRLESEMTKEEISESEKAKWMQIKNKL